MREGAEWTVSSLLSQALRAGMGVLEFWELTPGEVIDWLGAAAWREERAQERLAWQVWHIAALTRARRLPALGKLLRREPVELTPEEIRERKADHEAAVARYKAQQRRNDVIQDEANNGG